MACSVFAPMVHWKLMVTDYNNIVVEKYVYHALTAPTDEYPCASLKKNIYTKQLECPPFIQKYEASKKGKKW